MYRKYFTISFDDGLEQDKELIKLMNKYGIKGTFNLNSGLFGLRQHIGRISNVGIYETPIDGKHPRIYKYHNQFRIPADEIAQVYDGFEIASHTATHKSMKSLKENEYRQELDDDIRTLSALSSKSVCGFAYPFGQGSAKAARELRSRGIVYGRLVGSNDSFLFPENPCLYVPSCSHTSKKAEQLIERFVAAKAEEGDLLFMLWGHGYELDFNTKNSGYEKLNRLFGLVAGKQDIVYCTNAEAFTAHAGTI